MSNEQLAQMVENRLQKYHPGGATLHVLANDIRQEGEYWYVPVLPTIQPKHTFEYYDALAEVETDLSLNEKLKIWLIPTVPDEIVPHEEVEAKVA